MRTPSFARTVSLASANRRARGLGGAPASRAHFLGVAGPALLAVAMVAGCGRRATEIDCSFIMDRNVEVQMKAMNVTDPASIDKRKKEIHDQLKGELQGCVGKRITDTMLACVARAQSAEDIDTCMR